MFFLVCFCVIVAPVDERGGSTFPGFDKVPKFLTRNLTRPLSILYQFAPSIEANRASSSVLRKPGVDPSDFLVARQCVL